MTDYLDTLQEWTFHEDEGGTLAIVANPDELTVAIFRGPDCDGTTSQSYYEFEPIIPPGTEPWYDNHSNPYTPEPGTYYRTGPWRDSAIRIHSDNPESAYHDFLISELGSALFCNPLRSQPEC